MLYQFFNSLYRIYIILKNIPLKLFMNPIELKTILEKHLYKKEKDITNPLYEGKTITIYNETNYNETKEIRIKFRTGKKTPTYKGHFIAFYKKENQIAPYDISDFDFLAVLTESHRKQYGIFIFSNSFLAQEKIITTNREKGKLGFRTQNFYENTKENIKKQYIKQNEYFYQLTNEFFEFFRSI
jgi:hypothetical protein